MGVPCRWHIARFGVPQFRPAAVAIAVVIAGSMLLETGGIAFAPIESDDLPAPIAAETGPGDAFVATVLPDPDAPVAPAIGSPSTVAPERALDAIVPFAFKAGGAVDAPSSDLTVVLGPDVASAMMAGADPFAIDPMRALDPELEADLLMAAFTLEDVPVLAGAATTATARVAAQGQAGSSAKRTTTTASAKKLKGWRRKAGPWRNSPLVTWYGPGFYGNRTACGQRYTRHIVGVAHRTLPCGTMVQFRWHGRTAVAPVIDRGPYGPRALVFDWSAGLACQKFKPKHARNGCFTRADVGYRVVGKVNLKEWFAHLKAMRRKRKG